MTSLSAKKQPSQSSSPQTRLSTLQGRGETSIRCMLSADVQRTAHEIAFKGSPDNVAGSIAVTVTLTR